MVAEPAARGATGRADLLRAFAAGGEKGLAAMAHLVGYEDLRPAVEEESLPKGRRELDSGEDQEQATDTSVPDPDGEKQPAEPFAPIPFWRLEEIEEVEPLPTQASKTSDECMPLGLQGLGRLEGRRPLTPPILAAPRLWPALRSRLVSTVPSREVDVPKLAELWSKGRFAESIPFRPLAAWAPRVTVLVDRSDRLIPFWRDQDRLLEGLRRRLGSAGVHEVLHVERLATPWIDRRGHYRSAPVSPGEPILALGDLGFLGNAFQRSRWRAVARVRQNGAPRPIALLPCPAERWDHDAARAWEAMDWSRPRRAPPLGKRLEPGERRLRAERLLALLSFASRIEPGLLRTVRRLLPPGEADLGTEADAWAHPDLVAASSSAASLAHGSLDRLRARFVEEDDELKRHVVNAIRTWRATLPKEIWNDEVHGLTTSGLLPAGALRPAEIEEARAFWLRIAATLDEAGKLPAKLLHAVRGFSRRTLYDRQPDAIWQDAELRPILWKIWKAAWYGGGQAPYPPGIGPEILGPSDLEARRWQIVQQGSELIPLLASETSAGAGTGSPLAVVAAARLEIKLEGGSRFLHPFYLDGETPIPLPPNPSAQPSLARAPSIVKPPWATAVGRDHFGAWATFEVEGVVQKMRWIPPGRFMMGSPEDEPGRWEDEGPRHEEVIRQGFWLAETSCTQALWQAVTGKNPSRFQSPERPVEQVSWEDCRAFLEALKGKAEGLDLRFPSEAEWEYACRAGTETATYAGPMEILGQRNAPVLDAIAWYGGNSGEGFELENGVDSSEWEETQYHHQRAGSRPVAKKAPNPWGLYDMLGNVDEWCGDLWCSNYDSPREGTDRVFRGGSWDRSARRVRAAYRYRSEPSLRDDGLGFRLARDQAALQPGAEPGVAKNQGLEPGQGGAGPVRSPSPRPPAAAPAIILRTDKTAALLRRIERPTWASAMGRDRFGLWASFELEGVQQRMRWIVPGSFMMGSPEDEPGRWEAEGPRHLETIPRGFWLADTPCTQDLWQVVTGENPSHFKTPERPVETVSWEDCRDFMVGLNDRIEGLEARFPLETEWEYACRAGTDTATYAGPIEILGENNAPVLDAVAWYGGNSGVGFDLENGADSSRWPEKQHPHSKAGTRPVAGKEPNSWGLYDTLGNVWEWCGDLWRPDYNSPPEGTDRVIRGGSWYHYARYVRAAYRSHYEPSGRNGDLGFRLARGQGALKSGAEPSGVKDQEAEPGQGGAGPVRRPPRPEDAAP